MNQFAKKEKKWKGGENGEAFSRVFSLPLDSVSSVLEGLQERDFLLFALCSVHVSNEEGG